MRLASNYAALNGRSGILFLINKNLTAYNKSRVFKIELYNESK